MPKPAVIFAPHATEQLNMGFEQLATLLATTLGPSQGMVLSSQDAAGAPELLTDAATIARRVVGLPDRRQNVGAMLLRQLVWRMHQRLGDGAATTAVLAHALLQHTTRLRAAGANPMVMQQGIRAATQTAVSTLRTLAQPATNWETLAAVGHSTTGHRQLGDILGELVELLGPNGHVTLNDTMSPTLDRVYLNGGRWQASLISPYLMTATAVRQAIHSHCHIALYADRLHDPTGLPALLEAIAQSPNPNLLLIAYEFSDDVRNILVGSHSSDSKLKIAATKLERGGEHGRDELEDLALLTGATVLGSEKGRPFTTLHSSDLGQAGRIEAGEKQLLVQQGKGNPAHLRHRIEQLQQYSDSLPFSDSNRQRLQERIARLSGNIAVLHIGAHTKAERTFLHQAAAQGVKTVQAAARGGVLPGGATAYLHCLAAIAATANSLSGEARFGAQAVAHALQAPFATLLRNGGVTVPALAQQEILAHPPGLLFDVMTGKLTNAHAAELLDAADVVIGALETAVSGATMASSIDTVILNKKPEMSYEP